MATQNLILYKRTEDLLYKMYPRLANYPKSEKFSLCHTIKETFFDLLGYISMVNNVKPKRITYLQEADASLQKLKTLVKLSKQRKYISVGFFKDVDTECTEINKLLRGYIRSAVK